MPHPFVLVAGFAFAVGAGLMIYNEFLNPQREQSYRTTTPQPTANNDSQSEQAAEEEDQEEKLYPSSPARHPALLRHRKNTRDDDYNDYYLPLIDLPQQCQPPSATNRLTSSTRTQEPVAPADLTSNPPSQPILQVAVSSDDIQRPASLVSPSTPTQASLLALSEDAETSLESDNEAFVHPPGSDNPWLPSKPPSSAPDGPLETSDEAHRTGSLNLRAGPGTESVDECLPSPRPMDQHTANQSDLLTSDQFDSPHLNPFLESDQSVSSPLKLESMDEGWSDLGSETFEAI